MHQSLYTENTVQCVRYCGDGEKRRAERNDRQVKRLCRQVNIENAGMHNEGEVKLEERMAGVLIKHRTSL